MAKKETLDVIEETINTIDETLDVIEKHKSLVVPVALVAGVAGLLVGGTIGYIIAKKRLQPKYEKLAQQEIAEAKQYYRKEKKEGALATPEGALAELAPEVASAARALVDYSKQSEREEDDSPEVQVEVTTSVFTGGRVHEEFDIEEEMKSRQGKQAYIISREEFLEADPGFEQKTLTYYEGDNTLSDDTDEAIPIPDQILGEDALGSFGYGSQDPRTVYVRNERLRLDFEVVKSDGQFSHEVLGLQHSDEMFERRGRNRKFRGDDE